MSHILISKFTAAFSFDFERSFFILLIELSTRARAVVELTSFET